MGIVLNVPGPITDLRLPIRVGVRLDERPSSPVVVTATYSANNLIVFPNSAGSTNKRVLNTFTADNWNVEQELIVAMRSERSFASGALRDILSGSFIGGGGSTRGLVRVIRNPRSIFGSGRNIRFDSYTELVQRIQQRALRNIDLQTIRDATSGLPVRSGRNLISPTLQVRVAGRVADIVGTVDVTVPSALNVGRQQIALGAHIRNYGSGEISPQGDRSPTMDFRGSDGSHVRWRFSYTGRNIDTSGLGVVLATEGSGLDLRDIALATVDTLPPTTNGWWIIPFFDAPEDSEAANYSVQTYANPPGPEVTPSGLWRHTERGANPTVNVNAHQYTWIKAERDGHVAAIRILDTADLSNELLNVFVAPLAGTFPRRGDVRDPGVGTKYRIISRIGTQRSTRTYGAWINDPARPTTHDRRSVRLTVLTPTHHARYKALTTEMREPPAWVSGSTPPAGTNGWSLVPKGESIGERTTQGDNPWITTRSQVFNYFQYRAKAAPADITETEEDGTTPFVEADATPDEDTTTGQQPDAVDTYQTTTEAGAEVDHGLRVHGDAEADDPLPDEATDTNPAWTDIGNGDRQERTVYHYYRTTTTITTRNTRTGVISDTRTEVSQRIAPVEQTRANPDATELGEEMQTSQTIVREVAVLLGIRVEYLPYDANPDEGWRDITGRPGFEQRLISVTTTTVYSRERRRKSDNSLVNTVTRTVVTTRVDREERAKPTVAPDAPEAPPEETVVTVGLFTAPAAVSVRQGESVDVDVEAVVAPTAAVSVSHSAPQSGVTLSTIAFSQSVTRQTLRITAAATGAVSARDITFTASGGNYEDVTFTIRVTELAATAPAPVAPVTPTVTPGRFYVPFTRLTATRGTGHGTFNVTPRVAPTAEVTVEFTPVTGFSFATTLWEAGETDERELRVNALAGAPLGLTTLTVTASGGNYEGLTFQLQINVIAPVTPTTEEGVETTAEDTTDDPDAVDTESASFTVSPGSVNGDQGDTFRVSVTPSVAPTAAVSIQGVSLPSGFTIGSPSPAWAVGDTSSETLEIETTNSVGSGNHTLTFRASGGNYAGVTFRLRVGIAVAQGRVSNLVVSGFEIRRDEVLLRDLPITPGEQATFEMRPETAPNNVGAMTARFTRTAQWTATQNTPFSGATQYDATFGASGETQLTLHLATASGDRYWFWTDPIPGVTGVAGEYRADLYISGQYVLLRVIDSGDINNEFRVTGITPEAGALGLVYDPARQESGDAPWVADASTGRAAGIANIPLTGDIEVALRQEPDAGTAWINDTAGRLTLQNTILSFLSSDPTAWHTFLLTAETPSPDFSTPLTFLGSSDYAGTTFQRTVRVFTPPAERPDGHAFPDTPYDAARHRRHGDWCFANEGDWVRYSIHAPPGTNLSLDRRYIVSDKRPTRFVAPGYYADPGTTTASEAVQIGALDAYYEGQPLAQRVSFASHFATTVTDADANGAWVELQTQRMWRWDLESGRRADIPFYIGRIDIYVQLDFNFDWFVEQAGEGEIVQPEPLQPWLKRNGRNLEHVARMGQIVLPRPRVELHQYGWQASEADAEIAFMQQPGSVIRLGPPRDVRGDYTVIASEWKDDLVPGEGRQVRQVVHALLIGDRPQSGRAFTFGVSAFGGPDGFGGAP